MPLLPRGLPHLAILLTLVFVVSACGADIGEEPFDEGTTTSEPGETRVASAQFDGQFSIREVLQNGEPFPLETVATMEIETIFGGLTVIPGCNTYFGSFTLADAGEASFTIAGGSQQDCGSLNAQEDAVVAALRAVESWTGVEDGFRFDGGDGWSLSVSR